MNVFSFLNGTEKAGFTPTPESHGHKPVDEWGSSAKRTYKSRGRKPMVWGFTLLEVVVALAVILAALVGPVALITRGLFDFRLIKNKLIALNLAQEGIEAIRAVRENNIICGNNWLLNSNGIGTLFSAPQPRKVSVRGTDTVVCGANTVKNPRTDIPGDCNADFLNTNYGYGVALPSTIFHRCVRIDLAIPPEDGIPPSQMVDITSRVTWDEQGSTKNVELKERLYKWQYPLSN